MNLGVPRLALAALAAAAIGIALWAGPNVDLAAPAATVACLAAVALAAGPLVDRLRPERLPEPPVEADTLVRLGASFREGVLGRRSILATLGGLELAALGRSYHPLGLEEEEKLVAATPAEFRRWVEGRLAELERLS